MKGSRSFDPCYQCIKSEVEVSFCAMTSSPGRLGTEERGGGKFNQNLYLAACTQNN